MTFCVDSLLYLLRAFIKKIDCCVAINEPLGPVNIPYPQICLNSNRCRKSELQMEGLHSQNFELVFRPLGVQGCNDISMSY
ncbi:hypothetical protein HNY73_014393 [Argiope bruennichi]|uniref:Uncharacterized protein n=1 Tax=Argiope bruennichi TaxID=94029 RepID=A0A8T0ENS8_ARGBR|nr:hypothetical protein HNY73_014393 [Argiope bruennichi]